MTVNFGGFKNTAAVFTNDLDNRDIVVLWTQLTNKNGRHFDKYKNLLEKYPSEDGFIRVAIHKNTVPLEHSTVSINDRQIRFNETKKIEDVMQVRSLLNDIIDNPEPPVIEKDYIQSMKPIENIGIILDDRDLPNPKFTPDIQEIIGDTDEMRREKIESLPDNETMEAMHDGRRIKSTASLFLSTIKQKYAQFFSS